MGRSSHVLPSFYLYIISFWLKKSPKLFKVYESLLSKYCYIFGRSQSYINQRDKNLPKLTKLSVNNRRFDGRTPESPAALANQVSICPILRVIWCYYIGIFFDNFVGAYHSVVYELYELETIIEGGARLYQIFPHVFFPSREELQDMVSPSTNTIVENIYIFAIRLVSVSFIALSWFCSLYCLHASVYMALVSLINLFLVSFREFSLNSRNKFLHWMREWMSLHLVLKNWIQRSLSGEFQLVNKAWLCRLKHSMAMDPLLFLQLAWGMVHWLGR